jgi:hypothetical protein
MGRFFAGYIKESAKQAENIETIATNAGQTEMPGEGGDSFGSDDSFDSGGDDFGMDGFDTAGDDSFGEGGDGDFTDSLGGEEETSDGDGF